MTKEERISIEKCLDLVPNKFELTVLAMNRARDLLMGSSTSVIDSKYAKKHVNKALAEIEGRSINLDELKARIRANILDNNLFLKDIKHENDETDVNQGESLDDLDDNDMVDDNDDDFDFEELEDVEIENEK